MHIAPYITWNKNENIYLILDTHSTECAWKAFWKSNTPRYIYNYDNDVVQCANERTNEWEHGDIMYPIICTHHVGTQ